MSDRTKRLALLSGVLLLAAAVRTAKAADPPAADADAIIGQWQGTSLCTNREVAPGCKDEKTRYTCTRAEGSGKIHMVADKLVNGEFVSMGDLDFDYVPAERRWKSELKSAHAVWSFAVEGDRLSGTLVDAPTGAETRKVSAARQPERHGDQGH
ncbi:MAG TPA: hypothetical protein VGO79_06250 [Thermoanaerobaculia bacterium]|jgi:hypothetical protein